MKHSTLSILLSASFKNKENKKEVEEIISDLKSNTPQGQYITDGTLFSDLMDTKVGRLDGPIMEMI